MRHPLLLHHVQNLKSKIYLKFYMFRKGIERMLGEYKVLSIVILELIKGFFVTPEVWELPQSFFLQARWHNLVCTACL